MDGKAVESVGIGCRFDKRGQSAYNSDDQNQARERSPEKEQIRERDATLQTADSLVI